jgi:enoyl-CoA hydratase/carnithine racemase
MSPCGAGCWPPYDRWAVTGTAVRAVLLTAQGKHFCVGQDLKEHARALEAGPESAFACVRTSTTRSWRRCTR